MGNDDEIERTFEGEWGTAKVHADGSITAEHRAAKIEMAEDGSGRIKLEKLTRVTIENIIDVQSHAIKKDASATSHHILYYNGGEVRFSYRQDGRLLEFSARGIAVSISNDGAVTLKADIEKSN